MHLKNFSLISEHPGKYVLSPTYDQVPTAIVMPEETEEMALSLNGFQKKILALDFREAMEATGISRQMGERIIRSFSIYKDKWSECISSSFVSDRQKNALNQLIDNRLDRLNQL